MSSSWQITETAFSPETAKAYEGLFTLGSGYLHVRGSLEEHLFGAPQNVTYTRKPVNVTAEKFPETKSRWGTFVPGLFAPHPLLGNEMVNLPSFLELAPYAGGEKCDMETSAIEGYARTLDLRTATLARSFRWKTRLGPVLSVRFERFVSQVRPSLCVQRMTLAADKDTSFAVRAGIVGDVRTNGYDHFESVDVFAEPGGSSLESEQGMCCSVRTEGGDEAALVSRLAAPGAAWRFDKEPRRGTFTTELVLAAGEPLAVEKRTAVATSRDLDERPPADVLDLAAALTWDELRREHTEAWAARWERSDVVIEGDEESQVAMRCSIYHLLRAHVPGDPRVAIDAKGYAGDAYFGRYFWDTEMFLLPFFLYTDPARARTLVQFRVNNLDGARRNAASKGKRGARYPWESDGLGRECCAIPLYADGEIHVTADVAHGLAHYAHAVDKGYLEGPAAAVLVETARFWIDRIEKRPGDDYPSLLGVMGSDEYTPQSDNNAFTNGLAAFNLDLAARFGEAGGAAPAEREAFAEAAAKLPLCRGGDGKLLLQCEGFERLADPAFGELWKDRSRPFASQVSEERLHRSRCLKQADVIMLMALFPGEFTEEEVPAAWDYYLPLTTHDSSLSACIHSIVASRLGLKGAAWDFWLRGAGLDRDVANGGAAEGIHIAACGGNWQAAVFGFAGMKTALQSDVLSLDPRLPASWARLAFPVVWKGSPVYIDITPGRCRVSNRGDADLEVAVCGAAATVLPREDADTCLSGRR